jgi:DNA polymerase III delta subunit
MIYIVHGEDFIKSRDQIINQLKKLGVKGKTELAVSDTTPEQIFELACSQSLFAEPQFIVLDITSAGKLNVDGYIEILKKIPADVTVVVLSAKALTKTNAFIKSAAELKAKIISNEKLPASNIFSFVDALFSKQRLKTYQELLKLIKDDEDPFRIFSMILYGLRNIAAAKFGSPAIANYKPFMKSKLEAQSAKFTEENVKNLFDGLYEIDKGAKTGEITPELMVTLAVEKVLNS